MYITTIQDIFTDKRTIVMFCWIHIDVIDTYTCQTDQVVLDLSSGHK